MINVEVYGLALGGLGKQRHIHLLLVCSQGFLFSQVFVVFRLCTGSQM